MKKTEYPNRGHLLTDYFIDGISRVYEHEENVIIILESPTGIETPNAILKNECVRLVIPKSKFNNFFESVLMIKNNLDYKEVPEISNEQLAEKVQKSNSFLGSAFNISD